MVSAMTPFSIRLLGRFRAQRGGGPALAIHRKKAQALLAYLAVRPGLAASRDALAGLLWPGTTDQHARHNLRQSLFALRQVIAPTPFVVDGDLVRLDEKTVDLDVAAFERGVRQGTREALREAVDLYQGELLEGLRLDEAPFDDWLGAERLRLRELALGALEKLLSMELGDAVPE